MKEVNKLLTIGILITLISGCNNTSSNTKEPELVSDPPIELPGEAYVDPSFEIDSAQMRYEPALDSYFFTIKTNADAASVVPVPAGQIDGAPVLGYVFLTDLLPSDIGYLNVEGQVALVVTTHPDLDDTPLWDENNNQSYDDDGALYHSHWVVLNKNDRAKAGLAVAQASETDVLTPTSPMAMYLDSPNYTILEKGDEVHVVVPANAVKRRTDFSVEVVTAYMEVDASEGSPLLKVERIYDKYASSLSLLQKDLVPESNLVPTALGNDDSLQLTDASVDFVEAIDSLIFSVYTKGDAATKAIEPLGKLNGGPVDGAPLLGYVFPTSIPLESVGFNNLKGATLALAVTIHPDFDDTPLFDENRNDNFEDDGAIYHTHWVALVEDGQSVAGLSVPSSFNESDLPPTAPMKLYLDSPNFHVFTQGKMLRVIVPTQRVNGVTEFQFDSVTAGMNVDLSGDGPVVRVNKVHDVLSGDLSLPYSVTKKKLADY